MHMQMLHVQLICIQGTAYAAASAFAYTLATNIYRVLHIQVLLAQVLVYTGANAVAYTVATNTNLTVPLVSIQGTAYTGASVCIHTCYTRC